MGLGGSVLVKAAALAAASASSLPVIPLCPGITCTCVGIHPGRVEPASPTDALVSTGGSSGPVERLGGILDGGSLETDVQLP